MKKHKVTTALVACAAACSLFVGAGSAYAQDQPYEVVYTGAQSFDPATAKSL